MNTAMARTISLPLIALRDSVIFPEVVEPLFIGRERFIKTANEAYKNDSEVFVIAQKDASIDEISKTDLFEVGTIARIYHLMNLSDGTIKILVGGIKRAHLKTLKIENDIIIANIIEQKTRVKSEKSINGMVRAIKSTFEQFCKQNRNIPPLSLIHI